MTRQLKLPLPEQDLNARLNVAGRRLELLERVAKVVDKAPLLFDHIVDQAALEAEIKELYAVAMGTQQSGGADGSRTHA